MLTCTRSFVLAPLAAMLVAASAFATDFTVGPASSGADFVDIQSALDAATGTSDRVFVLPGVYRGSITIDHDVDLIGSGPGLSVIEPTLFGFLAARPHITIAGTAAQESVRVVGFSFEGTPFAALRVSDGYLDVRDCAGPVTLSDLQGDPVGFIAETTPMQEGAVRVENCERVFVDRCVIRALGSGLAETTPSKGRAGLWTRGSSVWVNNSTFWGGLLRPADTVGVLPAVGVGGAGLDAGGSTVVLAWSEFHGASGTSEAAPLLNPTPGTGGPGLRVRGGARVTVRGGATSRVFGGGGGFLTEFDSSARGGSAVQTTGDGAVIADAGAFFSGGLDGLGQVQAAVHNDNAGGTFEVLAFETLALRTSTTQAAAGANLALELSGPPNSLIGLFSDNATTAPLPLAGFLGEVLILPATSETLLPVVTDAEGRGQVIVQVPLLAAPGAVRYLQAAVLESGAPASISGPATLSVAL